MLVPNRSQSALVSLVIIHVLQLAVFIILKSNLHIDLSEAVLHVFLASVLPPLQSCCSMYSEAKNTWLVASLGLGRLHGGVDLEQDVVE